MEGVRNSWITEKGRVDLKLESNNEDLGMEDEGAVEAVSMITYDTVPSWSLSKDSLLLDGASIR